MKTKTIRLKYSFDATPLQVYSILMDAKHHAAFTESKVSITEQENEKFTAYDGYITGRNKQLIRGEKIVQSWHCTDFPDGHLTEVTYLLKKNKAGGCDLEFTQTNVPTENYKQINQGWIDHYFHLMEAYLLVQKKS